MTFMFLILTIHKQHRNFSRYHENLLLNVLHYIFLSWNHVKNEILKLGDINHKIRVSKQWAPYKT